jgi:membrane protein
MVSGAAFGRYLANYAFAYVSMYAGLASAMVALVFLYVCAAIFIYGGELNSVIQKARASRLGPARPRVSGDPGRFADK